VMTINKDQLQGCGEVQSLSWKRLMTGLTTNEMGEGLPAAAWTLKWYKHKFEQLKNVTDGNIRQMPPLATRD
jgi:hypothetical protein